jgi:hypothetical protein
MDDCTSQNLIVTGELPSSCNEHLEFIDNGTVCFGGVWIPPSVLQYFLDLFRSGVGSKQDICATED